MRIIPKKTKVKVEFYRNFTLTDIIIALIGFGIEVLLLFTNFGALQYVLMAIVLGLFICLYLPVASEKLYMQIGNLIWFVFSRKTYKKNAQDAKNDMQALIPFKGIGDELIEYGE